VEMNVNTRIEPTNILNQLEDRVDSRIGIGLANEGDVGNRVASTVGRGCVTVMPMPLAENK
jgi:hypothetical protein